VLRGGRIEVSDIDGAWAVVLGCDISHLSWEI
jgi:hypothetical protein